jgi:hypothetical protein
LSCSNTGRLAKNEVRYMLSPKVCKECNKPIPYLKRNDNIFCCSSCSTSYNNSKREKKQRFCASCNLPVKKNALNCSKCYSAKSLELSKQSIESYGEKTVSSFSSTYARHKYQKIRLHAHRIMKSTNISKSCCVCGYEKHVELAHKRSISSFPKLTKLKVVNSLENLIFLCPNHHWELDAGLLEL